MFQTRWHGGYFWLVAPGSDHCHVRILFPTIQSVWLAKMHWISFIYYQLFIIIVVIINFSNFVRICASGTYTLKINRFLFSNKFRLHNNHRRRSSSRYEKGRRGSLKATAFHSLPNLFSPRSWFQISRTSNRYSAITYFIKDRIFDLLLKLNVETKHNAFKRQTHVSTLKYTCRYPSV